MPELRWILLGAGIALILGLWWWETRKARAGSVRDEPPETRKEPVVHSPADDGVESPAEPVTRYAPTIERARVQRRPPIVEIPDDLEVDVSAYVGRDRRRLPQYEPPEQPASATPADSAASATPAARELPPEDEERDDHERAPWIRTQPLERTEMMPAQDPEAAEAVPSDPREQQTIEASRQRIVALRLVAHDGRWIGSALREALEGEGLNYGRFSIFHREREDGKPLFYVASMMEPGSFDLARMDQQSFPGVSLFGVVPGPLEAPALFDLILATGRRLAERLKGQLQDEQGSTLTAQRILNLREELVHYEHRNRRLRRS